LKVEVVDGDREFSSMLLLNTMKKDPTNSTEEALGVVYQLIRSGEPPNLETAQKFISKGDKVKFTIRFKGRELQHSHLGNKLMNKIKEDMKVIGKVELDPKFDGKQMIMVIQPL